MLKVWIDIRSSANSRIERGHALFTESEALLPFFKKIDGGVCCPVLDGNVLRDDMSSVPGVIDMYGNELGSNPLR